MTLIRDPNLGSSVLNGMVLALGVLTQVRGE